MNSVAYTTVATVASIATHAGSESLQDAKPAAAAEEAHHESTLQGECPLLQSRVLHSPHHHSTTCYVAAEAEDEALEEAKLLSLLEDLHPSTLNRVCR